MEKNIKKYHWCDLEELEKDLEKLNKDLENVDKDYVVYHVDNSPNVLRNYSILINSPTPSQKRIMGIHKNASNIALIMLFISALSIKFGINLFLIMLLATLMLVNFIKSDLFLERLG